MYKSGVYKCSNMASGSRTGYHSVRIVGWGEEYQNGRIVKYWVYALVTNSKILYRVYHEHTTFYTLVISNHSWKFPFNYFSEYTIFTSSPFKIFIIFTSQFSVKSLFILFLLSLKHTSPDINDNKMENRSTPDCFSVWRMWWYRVWLSEWYAF